MLHLLARRTQTRLRGLRSGADISDISDIGAAATAGATGTATAVAKGFSSSSGGPCFSTKDSAAEKSTSYCSAALEVVEGDFIASGIDWVVGSNWVWSCCCGTIAWSLSLLLPRCFDCLRVRVWVCARARVFCHWLLLCVLLCVFCVPRSHQSPASCNHALSNF